MSSLNLLLFGWIPFPSRWERMVLGRTGVLAGVSSLSRRGCWGRTEQWAMGRAQERLEVLVCVCTRVWARQVPSERLLGLWVTLRTLGSVHRVVGILRALTSGEVMGSGWPLSGLQQGARWRGDWRRSCLGKTAQGSTEGGWCLGPDPWPWDWRRGTREGHWRVRSWRRGDGLGRWEMEGGPV